MLKLKFCEDYIKKKLKILIIEPIFFGKGNKFKNRLVIKYY